MPPGSAPEGGVRPWLQWRVYALGSARSGNAPRRRRRELGSGPGIAQGYAPRGCVCPTKKSHQLHLNREAGLIVTDTYPGRIAGAAYGSRSVAASAGRQSHGLCSFAHAMRHLSNQATAFSMTGSRLLRDRAMIVGRAWP
jgi:hypothetical protein